MREYLRDRRKKIGLKQSDVAASMGISANYYNYIENGKRQAKMTYGIMEKLAAALDMPVDDIISAERGTTANEQV